MKAKTKKPKKAKQRLEWPERIPDTPENVARALWRPPKKEWNYLKGTSKNG